ncbi:hypothetical protein [Chroococcidiopsis sp.]|uniref:hypothetical protein n=1 Tax=Chroococcidiopsis sp. TaxID=3088168 RepID=UPI003F2F5DD1
MKDRIESLQKRIEIGDKGDRRMNLKIIVIDLKLGNLKIIMPKEREPQILGKKQ